MRSLILASWVLSNFCAIGVEDTLEEQVEIDAAYEKAVLVLDAKLVSQVAISIVGTEVVTQVEEDRLVSKALDEITELDIRFGDGESAEKERHYSKSWAAEWFGKMDQRREHLSLTTIVPQRVLKGNAELAGKVIYTSSTARQNRHVCAADREAGDVRVFLFDGWDKGTTGVVPVREDSLAFGATWMEPSVSVERAREILIGSWKNDHSEIQFKKDQRFILRWSGGAEVCQGSFQITGKKDGFFRLLYSDVSWADGMKPEKEDDPFNDSDDQGPFFFVITELRKESLTLEVSDPRWSIGRAKISPGRFQRALPEKTQAEER